MNIDDLKSCANCACSSFGYVMDKHVRIGFHLINSGCNEAGQSCKNYDKWEYDGLTQKERAGQEIK